jgi:type I restriction enzyme R subunit
MSLNESIVEDAALEWFGELGYEIGHGPQLAPGEPAAERESFGEVVLVGRLREAIRRLNPGHSRGGAGGGLAQGAAGGDAFAHADEPRLSPDAAGRGAEVEYPRGDGSASRATKCGSSISAMCGRTIGWR